MYRCAKQHSEPTGDKRGAKVAEMVLTPLELIDRIAALVNVTALAVLRRQEGKHPTRVFTFQGKPLESANTRAWQAARIRAGIEDSSTLAKYLDRARDAGLAATKVVLLRDGFDAAWFENGQSRLLP